MKSVSYQLSYAPRERSVSRAVRMSRAAEQVRQGVDTLPVFRLLELLEVRFESIDP